MSISRRKQPETAKEFVDRLNNDPDYIAMREAKEQERLAYVARHLIAAQPVINDLKAAGFNYDTLDDLRRSRTKYVEAIPILVKWLPLIGDPSVKESVIRTLMVPWAKPVAVKPLLDAYRAEPDSDWTGAFRMEPYPEGYGHKWLLADALSMVADDSLFDVIAELAQDVRHGDSRAILAADALSKMKNPKAADVLIHLLDDEDIAGSALQGLRKLAPEQARPHFERFLTHWSKNLQREARKGLEKLDKKAAKKK